MPPVITLTTDFGLRDPFVGIMKGVLLSICPSARLVDLTHGVEPQDIQGAGLALEGAVAFFPPGTVHLAVVDPGVGSARRALAVRAPGYYLVGPDNGLFTFALEEIGWTAVALTAAEYRLPEVSRTFHGRDVFAPAAAHLARGVAPERFGPAVDDPVLVPWPEVRAVGGAVAGAVLHVDRFGNLITSIAADAVEALGAGVSVHIAGRHLPLVGTYADLPLGAAGALIGSGNRLEVAVREGSAAALLKARRGTPVAISSRRSTIRKSTKGRT
jgi:hypothetical protein